MASFVNRQDGSSPTLWLATRVGKMVLSCLLKITCCVLQEKLLWKPYNKSLIDQAYSVTMAGYWLRSFFLWVYGPQLSLSINTQKKELGQNPAILTSHFTYNPYILHKGCNVCCKLCGCGACPKEMFKIVPILAIFTVHVLYKGKWMKEGHSQSYKEFGCDL